MAYAALRTRNKMGFHPNLRGLGDCAPNWGFLPACENNAPDTSTPETPSAVVAMGNAVNMMCNNTGTPCNCDQFQDCDWYAKAVQQIEDGEMDLGWFSPTCSGIVAPNVSVFKTASGLALGTSSAGIGLLAQTGVIAASTAALAGAVTMGVGAIIAVIATIFAHHAAAAKQEQDVGCTSLAAVNNAMAVIAAEVRSGRMTPADAANAVGQIYPAYYSYINSSGVFGTSPFCNANCEMSVIVQGMDIYWQGQYNLMASQQSQAASQASAVSSSVATSPIAVSASAPISAQHLHPSPAVAAGASPAATKYAAPAPSVLSAKVAGIPEWLWFVGAAVLGWAVLA